MSSHDNPPTHGLHRTTEGPKVGPSRLGMLLDVTGTGTWGYVCKGTGYILRGGNEPSMLGPALREIAGWHLGGSGGDHTE